MFYFENCSRVSADLPASVLEGVYRSLWFSKSMGFSFVPFKFSPKDKCSGQNQLLILCRPAKELELASLA